MGCVLLSRAGVATAATQTFLYTGAEQTFAVPAGVSSVHVLAIGGAGGSTSIAAGGEPAQVSGDLAVAAGQLLYVEVGGGGASDTQGGAGGFNGGGGSGGGVAAGGGGASDVRTSPLATGLFPDSRLIIAAGGGGAAEGVGGTAGGAGAIGNAPGEGGGAGTATAGGAHGTGGCGDGNDGVLGIGGNGGASSVQASNGAGGGGGGLYGGGGGGAGCMSGGGGGGGGSSLVPAGGSQILVALGTPPEVQLTYTRAAPPVTPPSPPQPPVIALSGKHLVRLSRSGAISLFIRVSEDATGSATGTVNVPRGAKVLRFRRRSLHLKAGIRNKVTLTLSRRNATQVRRALRRRRLTAKVTIALRDASGAGSQKRIPLTLRR